MKGAIVYYGDWGHCRQVSEMIIKGLLEKDHEVALMEPDAKLPEDVEFFVAGAPTQLGKLPSSVRKFLKKQIGAEWQGRPFAAFSTGDFKQVAKGEKQAADLLYKELSDKGLVPLAPALKLGANSMKGDLREGALMSAYRFGIGIGAELNGEMTGEVHER